MRPMRTIIIDYAVGPGSSRTYAQNGTLRRERVSPLLNQLFICMPDWIDVPVQIAQSKRVHVAVSLPQTCIPIHLILKAVPGEPDDRYTVLFEAMDVRPLFVEPFHCVLTA